MNIVLLESLAISDDVLKSYAQPLMEEGHTFVAYERNTDPQVQISRAKNADVIMIANMPLSGEVINACDNLKFIDVAFTGVDHINIEAAKAKGIAVSNASGYSNEAVAELVMGMTLSLLRNVEKVEIRCREGKTKEGLVGTELKGKTVGIIGTGAIGSRVAELFHNFGCEIIAYDAYERDIDYVHYMPMDDVLKAADIVTIHCPLMESTRGLISAEKIGLMKQGAYLINCARGPIVDTKGLADALNSGKLAGAGIDVFEVEPPLAVDHPLLQAKNCLVTPHVAFASKESMLLRAEIVFNNLRQWMNGKQINKII